MIIIAFAWYRWSKLPSGKKVIHKIILKMPIVGPLAQEMNTARTASTLSSLLHSGVEVVESTVDYCRSHSKCLFSREFWKMPRKPIKKGDLMSKIFEENDKLYPVFFAEMLAVGEETGKMDEMLLNVAAFYEEDVTRRPKTCRLLSNLS